MFYFVVCGWEIKDYYIIIQHLVHKLANGNIYNVIITCMHVAIRTVYFICTILTVSNVIAMQ